MSVQGTNNLNIQSTAQTQATTDAEVRLQQQSAEVEVNNPAAEQYASQGMAIASPGDDVPPPPGQEGLEDEINQLHHDILDKEMELEELEGYLDELVYYSENTELTPEEQVAVQELIEEGRHLLLDIELELAALQQTLELRQAEFEQNSYGTANDWDGDGLTNEYEESIGTDVWLVDTDGDGISDLVEDAMARNAGLPVDPTQYSSTPNGVSDGVVFADEAQEAADALGVPVNGPAAQGGSGQSVVGGGSSTGGDTSTGGTSGADDEIPPPTGPSPDPDVEPINLGGSAGAESAGGQSAGGAGAMGTQSAGGMGIQDGGDPEDGDDVPPVEESKYDITERLEGHAYTGEETIEVEAVLGNDNTYSDVVLNGEGTYVITMDGDDIVIYYEDPDGNKQKIIIREGRYRKIFIQGLTSDSDTIVFHNVPQQVIRGATQIVDGEHTYAAGIFVYKDDGYSPAGVEHTSDTSDGSSVYGYGYSVTSSTSDDPPEAPAVDGAENVWVIEDVGRNVFGNDSSRLETIPEEDGGVYLEGEPGSQYLVQEYNMLAGEEQLYIHIPETVDGAIIKEVVVQENGDDLIYILKDSTGRIRKKIVIHDGVTFGNKEYLNDDGDWVAVTNIITVLADGLNDPLGYSEQGYSFGGQKISFAACEDTYADVRGGAGDDWIILSQFVGSSDTAQYDYADGGARNDIIEGGKSGATIKGGDGNDVLQGTQNADVIYGDDGSGDDGKDVIDGGGIDGGDSLYGGGDDDFIVARGTGNTIDGGSGVDITNVDRDGDNIVTDDTDSALDLLTNAISMIDMLEDMGLDPDTALEAKEWIEEIGEDAIDMISEKIHELFGMVLSVRKDAWEGGLDWDGAGDMSGSIGNMAGDPPEEDPPEGT